MFECICNDRWFEKPFNRLSRMAPLSYGCQSLLVRLSMPHLNLSWVVLTLAPSDPHGGHHFLKGVDPHQHDWVYLSLNLSQGVDPWPVQSSPSSAELKQPFTTLTPDDPHRWYHFLKSANPRQCSRVRLPPNLSQLTILSHLKILKNGFTFRKGVNPCQCSRVHIPQNLSRLVTKLALGNPHKWYHFLEGTDPC